MTINQRISAHFASIFVVFGIVAILFSVRYEKANAIAQLSNTLDVYANLMAKGYRAE